MISHVSLGVREFAKSAPFYDAILDPLGYPRVADTKPNELAYGPPGAALFWLYEMPGEGSLASPGTHIALQVETREGLHRAAAAAKELGSIFTREPGAHPDIDPDYYGAIFFDPDAHKIELVVEGRS